MIEVIMLKNGNKSEMGCWLDGLVGWMNLYCIVDIVMYYGMELDVEDVVVVEWYWEIGDFDMDVFDEMLNKLEVMIG